MRHERITIEGLSLAGPTSAARHLAPVFAGVTHERLAVCYLDGGFGLIRRDTSEGAETVALPIPRIARAAVAAGARAILLAHNHPGGDATPSRADRRATCLLAEALRPLSILLADHLVFGGDRWTSFHERGWL